MMLSRLIPSSDELLPVIGLGTYKNFDFEYNTDSASNLTSVLNTMKHYGGTLIDSSPMYGKSEAMVGQLTSIMPSKEEFFYATKVWINGATDGIKQMQQSMHLMQREKLDLIQVHNLLDYKTHLKTLRQWKEEGKVRYIGITHYTTFAHEELERIIRAERPDFVQFNYSIGVRNAEKRLLHTALDFGVAVIINEPFEKGTLFNMVENKSLPTWAADYQIENWAQFFLKYIISHPAVNVVIPATSNLEHAKNNMLAGVGPMPDEQARKQMRDFLF